MESEYLAYYINLSQSKKHIMKFNDREFFTQDIKEHFRVVGTPTIVFLKKDKLLFSYPGFMQEKRLIFTLQALLDEGVNSLEMDEVLNLMLKLYQEKGV